MHDHNEIEGPVYFYIKLNIKSVKVSQICFVQRSFCVLQETSSSSGKQREEAFNSSTCSSISSVMFLCKVLRILMHPWKHEPHFGQ